MRRRPLRLRRSGMTTHFSNQDLSESLRSLVSHIKPAPRKKTYDHRPHEVGKDFVVFTEIITKYMAVQYMYVTACTSVETVITNKF